MRHLLILLTLIIISSCNDNRRGMPEANINYTESTFNMSDSTCMTASDGIFVFKKLNADSISKAIQIATAKYFKQIFLTNEIQDSISGWLKNDFFSGKTYINNSWTLYADVDKTKLSCNYKALYGLERFDIDIFYENKICLKKIVGNLGSYEYIEEINGISYKVAKNRLRFLCDFYIDIWYRPKSLFNSTKQEYYRATLTDTVDMFTTLADSNFVYR